MPGLVVLGGDDRIEGVTQKVTSGVNLGIFCRIWPLSKTPRWVREMKSRLVDWISAACLLHATHLDIFAIMSHRYFMSKDHIHRRTVCFKRPALSGAKNYFWVKGDFWSILPTRMRIRLSSLGTPCSLVDVADSLKEQWVNILLDFHHIFCISTFVIILLVIY